MPDDYKFYVSVYVDYKEVSPSNNYYDDYQTAMDAAIGILDAKAKVGKSYHVTIKLVAIINNTARTVKELFLQGGIYEKAE